MDLRVRAFNRTDAAGRSTLLRLCRPIRKENKKVSTFNQDWTTIRRRFTLIEIIVVLVIMSTVLAIVMPRIGIIPLGVRVTQFADSVASAFNAASTIAMTTGKPVTVHFEFENQKIRIDAPKIRRMRVIEPGQEEVDDADYYNAGSVFDKLKMFELPEGVMIDEESPDYRDNRLMVYTFFPNGEASGPLIPMRIDRLRTSIDVDPLNGRAIMAPVDDE